MANLERLIDDHQSQPSIQTCLEKDVWFSPHGDPRSYQQSFNALLNDQSLTDFTDNLSSINRKTALDVMGYGEVLKDLPIDRGIAMALTDQRSSRPITNPRLKKIEMVTGNILHSQTWQKLADCLSGDRVQLILCRPLRGWMTIPPVLKVYEYFFASMYRFLDQNGVLLIQLPNQQPHPFCLKATSLYQLFLSRSLIRFDFSKCPIPKKGLQYAAACRFIKQNCSPEELPFI